jgi:hypothetical protein
MYNKVFGVDPALSFINIRTRYPWDSSFFCVQIIGWIWFNLWNLCFGGLNILLYRCGDLGTFITVSFSYANCVIIKKYTSCLFTLHRTLCITGQWEQRITDERNAIYWKAQKCFNFILQMFFTWSIVCSCCFSAISTVLVIKYFVWKSKYLSVNIYMKLLFHVIVILHAPKP